jgi:hypothetical protein
LKVPKSLPATVMVEYHYDFGKWKQAHAFTGGDDWGDIDDVRPQDIMQYDLIKSIYKRDLYQRYVMLKGDLPFKCIDIQHEHNFHFFYTGVIPEDGGDEPTEYICAVYYEKEREKKVLDALSEIGVDMSDTVEEKTDWDSECFIDQMLLNAPHVITAHDPWMKKIIKKKNPLENGKLYHEDDQIIKDMEDRKD